MKHLEMLKEAGFNTMDIVWKYYNLAVYLAMKQQSMKLIY
jgi:tRNA (cmo5U34)-methyltransferase